MKKMLLEELIKLHRKELQRLESISPNCESCVNFMSTKKSCAMANRQIPDEVIAIGCKEWIFDDIPF